MEDTRQQEDCRAAWSRGLANIAQLLPLSVILLSGVHFVVLAFDLPLLGSLPGWFFPLTAKPAGAPWLVAALVALPAAILPLVARRGFPWQLRVLLLVVLGFLLQQGFALTEGRGIDGMRDRMVKTGHAEFAVVACVQRSVGPLMSDYEQQLDSGSLGIYAHSKPPGQILLYLATERLTRPLRTSGSAHRCIERLRNFASIVWPLLTYLVLFPFFALARGCVGEKRALFACMLFVLVPSVNLVTLHTDQVFFPLFAVVPVWLAGEGARRGAPLWSAVAGVCVYLAGFCSFALFLAGPLAAAAALDAVLRRESGSRLHPLLMQWSALVSGFLLCALVFWLAFDYDILSRYRGAAEYHAQWKRWGGSAEEALYFGFLNSLEFAVFLGVPASLLTIAHFHRSASELRTNRPTPLRVLSLSLLAIFVALLCFGRTKGEVARLWLFLVPFCCLCASDRLLSHYSNRSSVPAAAVLALQWATVYLTKTHQDFW